MNRLTTWLVRWEEWMERWRRRRQLAGLNARALGDLGLDPALVNREIEKPFWRP